MITLNQAILVQLAATTGNDETVIPLNFAESYQYLTTHVWTRNGKVFITGSTIVYTINGVDQGTPIALPTALNYLAAPFYTTAEDNNIVLPGSLNQLKRIDKVFAATSDVDVAAENTSLNAQVTLNLGVRLVNGSTLASEWILQFTGIGNRQ